MSMIVEKSTRQVPCSNPYCRNRSEFIIGTTVGKRSVNPSTGTAVCNECMKSIINSILESEDTEMIKILEEVFPSTEEEHLSSQDTDDEVESEVNEHCALDCWNQVPCESCSESKPKGDDPISTQRKIEDLGYHNLVALAKSKGINTYKMKQREIEEMLKKLEG